MPQKKERIVFDLDIEQFVQVSGWVAAIIGAALLVWKVIYPVVKRIGFWITTWERFMLDWSGEDARPGRDRVPGVMERLNDIDGELKHNGGSSIKDAVSRIEKHLEKGSNKFDELEERLEKLEDKLD